MTNTNLPHGARYFRALDVIKRSETPLTKAEIEREARICPFNSERWWRFQQFFASEFVVHPVTHKVHRLSHE